MGYSPWGHEETRLMNYPFTFKICVHMHLFYSFFQHMFIECLSEVLLSVDGAVTKTESKPALMERVFLLGRWW